MEEMKRLVIALVEDCTGDKKLGTKGVVKAVTIIREVVIVRAVVIIGAITVVGAVAVVRTIAVVLYN